ncbi:MAG: DUF5668 domain-containing protein [bacterium]
MKNRNYFWGAFVLAIGIIMLLVNLNVYNSNYYGIYKIWPIVLILWGVTFLKISDIARNVISALSGLLLGVVLVSGILGITHSFQNMSNEFFFDHNNHYSHKMEFEPTQKTVDYQNEKQVTFNFQGGASYVRIGSGDGKLASAFAEYDSYVIGKDVTDGETVVNLDFDPTFNYSLNNSKKSKIDVMLNEVPNWIINVEAGASKLDFDLTKIKLDRMTIEVGVSDINLVFGDLSNSSKIDISCGLSNIKVRIPSNIGCRIITETAFSAHDFDKFIKRDDAYYSKNYNSSTKKIEFEIDGAFSNFEIIQY